MANKSESNVFVDIKRNRLYITLSCNPDKRVLDKVYTEIRFGVADLKPGFGVITDVSRCSIGHLNGIPTLKKIMDYLISNKVGQVVRVLGEKNLLFTQFLRLTTVFQGYTVAYVSTLEEAEDKFSHSPRRNSLRFYLHEQQIGYRIHQQTGTAKLKDISVSGCAAEDATIPLSPGTEISIAIPLHLDDNTPMTFTIVSKIVRAENNTFAAEFLDLDDDQKDYLYACLTFAVYGY